MPDDLDAILQELLVDAYGDAEQLTAFEEAFRQEVRFPFPARVVGTSIDVVGIEFSGDPRQGLIAVCEREGERYRVGLADLTPGPVTVATSRLIGAYRRRLGLPMLTLESGGGAGAGAAQPWTCRRVASKPAILAVPLSLNPMGMWDPADHYWGEEADDIDPVYQRIIEAGPRPEFEMERVTPGVGAEEWDVDPVADAAELHEAGRDRDATRLLRGLLAQDERCIDAWVHLGHMAFDNKGAKAALDFYDVAVGIGERSLPEDFSGVLPRGLIDNRPFLRALHGLGLCAWRQRRWEDAAVIFTNLVWIDGCQTWTSLECLEAVEGHERWSRG